MLRFEALPARYGDCLLISFEGADRMHRLLVDGGPGTVFRTVLRPHLDALRRNLPPTEPLVLDAVMVSHIDEDHILGILDLLESLQEAEQKRRPWPYRPTWLLHNSFDALIGEGDGGAARALGGDTVLAALGSGPLQLDRPPSAETLMVLQSYRQGSRLSTLAAALRIGRNPPSRQPLVFAPPDHPVLRIGDAVLRILGPLQPDLDELRAEWRAWRAKQKDTASLAAYLDDSVPNLSSLVVLLEHGCRRILLTGDARGDRILTGLRKANLLDQAGRMHVDILKLPHHGSSRNVAPDLFEAVQADHYIASGDGTYGNPDRETLRMIEDARPQGGYTVHLTYDAVHCDATHAEWRAGRRGPPYSAARESIADLVARWRAAGAIRVEEGPVSIDL